MNAPLTASRSYRWRRPKFIPLVVVLGAIITLIGFGSWQLDRLRWKEGLIAQIEEGNRTAPLKELPHDPAEIAAIPFRKVTLSGHFLNDHEFHLAQRYSQGMIGYHILTPFQLDDGRIVLLNRGWVPYDHKKPESRVQGLITGEVTLTAMVRTDNDRNLFTPDAEPQNNLWFWKDIPTMRGVSGLDIGPIPLDVIGMQVPGGLPKSLDGNITLRNDHLGYAITWYLLALGAALLFFVAHYRPEGEP